MMYGCKCENLLKLRIYEMDDDARSEVYAEAKMLQDFAAVWV